MTLYLADLPISTQIVLDTAIRVSVDPAFITKSVVPFKLKIALS